MSYSVLSINYLVAIGLAVTLACTSVQAEVPDLLRACQSCHLLEQNPAQANQEQPNSAPPLYFAGNKFRRDWLVSWLQDPQQIRPAGGFYAEHVKTVAGEDTLDASSLPAHMALSGEEAARVADWLMGLTPNQALLATESDYTPGNVAIRLGAMDFVKFKGCGGCHRDTPEYGGLTGPELYTAWNRLQPAFIVSYIRNPSAWDSHSLMPNRALGDSQIHKLADYLRAIARED